MLTPALDPLFLAYNTASATVAGQGFVEINDARNGVLSCVPEEYSAPLPIKKLQPHSPPPTYFTAGPKRSVSSFHETIILAFVFRTL